jgi:hypothetical protein
MNKRIMELAEQAGFYITIDGSGIFIPDPSTEDITEVSEKFAELIVRECAGVELYWLKEQDRKAVAEKIKKHFGVE